MPTGELRHAAIPTVLLNESFPSWSGDCYHPSGVKAASPPGSENSS